MAKRIKFKKKQLRMFWKFINERHQIYLNKTAGKEWPWTKYRGNKPSDFTEVLREYKFTNVYRQLDRVTEEWTKRYMKLQHQGASKESILFHCLVFRLFNWPQTYDELSFAGLIDRWNMKTAIKILGERQAKGEQIFTGAYIIPSGGVSDRPKLNTICRALDWCYRNRKELLNDIMHPRDAHGADMLPSMEQCVNTLQNIFTVGPFIAYEIACDLRHTKILANASDIMSWANPGPGAMRGIHRLMTGKAKLPGKKPDYIAIMRRLLGMAKDECRPHVFKCDWPFEMREIEHSLCEYDKLMRTLNGEGRPRSKYKNPMQRAKEQAKADEKAWLEKRAKKAKESQLDMFA